MNSQKIFRAINVMMLLATISAVPACASSNRGGRDGRQGPPPEAIEACQDKAEGDSVTFSGRRGDSVTATCTLIDDQLVAVPEGHKRK